jgi:pyridoxine 5-phosphate synthase
MRKKLGVNIDHVATVRQARLGTAPDPVTAAGIAELSGADGITVHLREDRRHIQDRDVEILKQVVQTRINLEMAATDEMVGIAKAIRPFSSTIVPEKREEVTTEGGLDVLSQRESLHETVSRLQEAGIFVSLFIDPDLGQVRAAKQAGADAVEIHTGTYCVAFVCRTRPRPAKHRPDPFPSGNRGVQHRPQHHREGDVRGPRAGGPGDGRPDPRRVKIPSRTSWYGIP